jgi:hypothetical protein
MLWTSDTRLLNVCEKSLDLFPPYKSWLARGDNDTLDGITI